MTLKQDVQHVQEEADEAIHAIESFEVRWKFVVFPALVAFVILASFGFYLIFGILHRMDSLSTDVGKMTQVIERAFPIITDDMHQMTQAVVISIPALQKDVAVMSAEVKQMSSATTSIATSTQNMGQNMWEVNKNISTPLSIMNTMIPWSNVAAPHPNSYPPQ